MQRFTFLNKIVKLIITLLLLSIVLSCKNESKKKINPTILKDIVSDTINTPNEIDKTIKPKLKPKVKYSEKLKNNLKGGIWVSLEYKDLIEKIKLRSTVNSILTTYSDIIFDGDSLLHCTYPYFMEEHVLSLKEDLTVGNNTFTIINVDDSNMVVADSENKKHNYFKINKKIIKNEIYATVTEGHDLFFYDWFAGEYELTIAGETTKLFFDKEAKYYKVFVWYPETGETFDVIKFSYKGENKYYKVNKVKMLEYHIEYHIEELEEFADVDGPIISKDIKGKLKKISNITEKKLTLPPVIRNFTGNWFLSNYFDGIAKDKTIAKYRTLPPTYFGIVLNIKDDSISGSGSIAGFRKQRINLDTDTITIINSMEKWALIKKKNKLILKQIPRANHTKDIATYIYEKNSRLESEIMPNESVNFQEGITNYFNKSLLAGKYKIKNTNKLVSFNEDGSVTGLEEFSYYNVRNYFGTLHPFLEKDVVFMYDNKDKHPENYNWVIKNRELILTAFTSPTREQYEAGRKNGRIGDYYVLGKKKIVLIRI